MWRLKGSKLLQSALRYKPLRRISLRYAQSTIPLDFIKWVIFNRKTVYIGKHGYEKKTTHKITLKLTETLIYETYRGDPFKH